jgi:hypothetical protein
MKFFKDVVLPVILATIWISISEFARNEYIVKTYWTSHYSNLGLQFPSAPINGAVWGIWSLLFAIVIFIFSKKFTLLQTTLLAWLVGFIMMWVVIGNLNVLPYGILPYAIPLSLAEAFVAAWILQKFSRILKNNSH